MKAKINLIIILFLLIVFIPSFLPIISAQDISYSNTQIAFLDMFGLNTIDNPFIVNQELGIINNFQVQKASTSSRKSCSGVSKLDIFDVGTGFPFDKGKKIKKRQPIVNLSLEETITLGVEREMKKKKAKMDKIPLNKTVPKMVGQKEIKKEKVSKMLKEDAEFKKMYDYAKELGYDKLNTSLEMTYDNGANTTIIILTSNDKKMIFVLKNSFNNITQDSNCSEEFLLMKFENVNGTITLTMFNKEGGVVLDFFNGSIISEWGHHSCNYWVCLGHCYSTISGIIRGICESVCSVCWPVLLDPLPGDEILCAPCFLCYAVPAAFCVGNCIEPCYWYPCQDDCNEYDDYYDAGWIYYCSDANTQKRYGNYRNYYCPEEYGPREGSCEYNSFNKTDPEYNNSCTYGCNYGTGNCYGATVCYADPDCGNSGWIGSPYCSGGDVWQYWREYTCYNPGTENSYCDDDNDYILKQECVVGECSDGECVDDCAPGYPWECNEQCWHCDGGDDDWSACCPDSGDPDWCCHEDGPYCDTGTGDCDVCGGDYPYECNDGCWGCTIMEGFEVCCPSSGNPQYCCNSTASVCMSDGGCCVPSIETCNNIDDNCDGTVDSFIEGCGVGACAGGTRTCTAGSWGSCSTAGQSTSETCDNIDNDCDSSVDESLTQECGTNIGECVKGTQTCSVGIWENCTGSYVGPTNETCNGLDDNCNNITDEDNVCGDYPNTTIIRPTNNYVSYTGNVAFICSSLDDINLANITLYYNISGNISADETKIITGTSNSTTWIVNNISNGTNFVWNCLVYDNDSHWSWSENGPYYINVSYGVPDDTHKFYIKNSTGDAVAWLGDEGNIVLKRNCFSGGSCDAPGPDSFIIRNSTNHNVAFINSTGDLCVETGDCSDQLVSCNPTRDAFIIRNSSNYNMGYIDFDGDLCLTGELVENSNP